MVGGATGQRDRREDLIARWPLVGRPIQDALDARVRARGSVLLVGDPGVGKTTLARALLDAASERGDHVVAPPVGAAVDPDVALGAFRSVLPPADGVPLPHLLRWARGRLEADAGGRPLLLGLDDVHELDPASAALVQQLVAGGAAAVLSARAGRWLPDAVRTLQRDGVLTQVDVAPLSPAEVDALLRHALGGPVAGGTVQALVEASAGNALYLRELCLHGLEYGALRSGGGVWTWRGPIGPSRGLRRLLVERLDALEPAMQDAVELLALAGTLGMEVCEALVGSDRIDRLERGQLVAVATHGRREEVRIAHPLLAEVVRDRCGDRAPALHARLADAVEAHGVRRRTDLARIAGWRLAAGLPVPPSQLVLAAGEAAVGFDHALAERLATAAVDAGGGPLASIALGSVWCDLGRFADAEHLWAGIQVDDTDPLRLQLAMVRAENLFFGLDRAGAAAALVDEAAESAATENERAQVTVQRAMLDLYGGLPGQSLATADELLRSDVAWHRRSAAMFVGPALAIEGRGAAGVRVLDLALADMDPESSFTSSAQTTGILLAGRYLALALAGRLAEATDQAAAAHQLAMALGTHEGTAVFAVAVGHAAVLTGRIEHAVVALEEAATLLREHDRNRYLPWCLGELAHARALAGDLDAAEAVLEEAEGSRSPAFRLFDALLDLGRVRVLVARGRRDEAAEVALAGGRWARSRGQHAFAAQLLHQAARLGDPGEVAAELRALAAASDSLLVAALSRHATGAAEGDGELIEAAAARLAEIGAHVLAGEAAIDAAAAHLAAGRRDRAFACALAATAASERCDGLGDGWLQPGPAADLLSRRELEVARLAAAGRTSRQVADELYVSLRTVENHLHRAYAKLGVPGREQLGAALELSPDPTEWAVAHDVAADPSYGPTGTGLREVEWSQMS